VACILDALDAVMRAMAQEFRGTIRFNVGDSYCVTFAEAAQAIAGAERLTLNWDAIRCQEQLGCTVSIGVHRGTLYAFQVISVRPRRLDRFAIAKCLGQAPGEP